MADTPVPRGSGPPPSDGVVRLVLVPARDHRRGVPADARVRRLRLARVAPLPTATPAERLAAARRGHD